jgi:anti-sigma B factor antagonist
MSDFAIQVEPSADATVRVRVAGGVDFAVGDELFDVLVAVLAAGTARDVEVDLSRVHLLDASAVGVLLAAHHRARRVGARFRVRGATGMPLRVLEIAGVLGVLGGKS